MHVLAMERSQGQPGQCARLFSSKISGGHGGGVTPVPIPNTEVKPASADGTWGETPWESRTPPDHFAKHEAPASAGASSRPATGTMASMPAPDPEDRRARKPGRGAAGGQGAKRTGRPTPSAGGRGVDRARSTGAPRRSTSASGGEYRPPRLGGSRGAGGDVGRRKGASESGGEYRPPRADGGPRRAGSSGGARQGRSSGEREYRPPRLGTDGGRSAAGSRSDRSGGDREYRPPRLGSGGRSSAPEGRAGGSAGGGRGRDGGSSSYGRGRDGGSSSGGRGSSYGRGRDGGSPSGGRGREGGRDGGRGRPEWRWPPGGEPRGAALAPFVGIGSAKGHPPAQ